MSGLGTVVAATSGSKDTGAADGLQTMAQVAFHMMRQMQETQLQTSQLMRGFACGHLQQAELEPSPAHALAGDRDAVSFGAALAADGSKKLALPD